ncbi:hypothetical protein CHINAEXTREME_06700 [Halobiforma lacisalsi AJ5]|uniref:DUF7577 domain-containing protein n=1 Tax=Natronobacterium lacisalsi AJ5 TaxID=358396 RepID=M0LYG2_NATLA|nr:hypothetical protein [Halobiforma lacisalsi]APW97478.1 hypothetical protein CHINAEXTREME_06700 [Halobiforma lacisalsi AJ5]EMA37145.1 hypothetical protein C445_02856 [Halobiforma lacisalsi AJ5]
MELWGWLIGYLVLFALLHLILYYVYVRRDGDGDGAGTPSFADPNRASSPSSPGPDSYPSSREVDEFDAPDEDRDLEGETIRCPHCGAHNASDQAYTYCWHCVSTLRR